MAGEIPRHLSPRRRYRVAVGLNQNPEGALSALCDALGDASEFLDGLEATVEELREIAPPALQFAEEVRPLAEATGSQSTLFNAWDNYADKAETLAFGVDHGTAAARNEVGERISIEEARRRLAANRKSP